MSKKFIDYLILEESYPDTLIQKIREYSAFGYKLHGSLIVLYTSDRNVSWYVQAMYREKETEL